MSDRASDDFAILAKRTRGFLQGRWQANRHLLKTPNGVRVVRAFGITVAVCLMVYGCQFAVHHSERVRVAAARQVEVDRRAAEAERVRQEEARVREEEWQKYARENSHHPVTYEVVYTSRVWLPVLGVLALIYALASRAFLFMAIGKILSLALLLTSVALLAGDAVPFVAEWEFFGQFKEAVTALAAHLNVPVTPPLWLGISLVGGIVVESLSRLGSRSKIVIKPPNIVLQPAQVVVNVPPALPVGLPPKV